MSGGTLLIIIGALVALSPFLGLPSSWLDVLVPLLGIAAICIGFLVRSRFRRSQSNETAPS